jgi:hypothetical protein
MGWNRVAAALVLLLLFGSASVAQANDGDRLILGRENTAESPTVLDAGFGEPDITALTVNNPHGDGAIEASCVTNDCYVLRAITQGGVGLLTEGEVGVSAHASPHGIGVSTHGGIDGSDGMALYAAGPTVFTRSGVVTIPAGSAEATVRLRDSEAAGKLTSQSFVLATPQQRSAARVFVRAAVADVSTNSFTIYLSKVARTGVRVGWFVVN